jgi:hypothetical protein
LTRVVNWRACWKQENVVLRLIIPADVCLAVNLMPLHSI